MAKKRISLRAVLYREDGLWFAHCLEMDVLGHGATQTDALGCLTGAILTQIEEYLRDGDLRGAFTAAEPKYFDMFFSGRDVAVNGECILHVSDESSHGLDDVEIPQFDAREYQGDLAYA